MVLLLGIVAVAVPVLLAIGVALGSTDSGDEGSATSDTGATGVDLDAVDTVAVASLTDMTAASDCVLEGEVEHTERGRAVGQELVSRLVRIRVDEALAGDCPSGTVVLEEEGWLVDGTPVTVQGWPGSAEGDVGVWFLVAGRSDELPYASTVVTAGAPRWRDGVSVAPESAPEWLRAVLGQGPEALAAAVRSNG